MIRPFPGILKTEERKFNLEKMSNTPVEDKRAGGGAGELNRTVQTVNETMRNHLLRIFTLHANSGFKAWNKEQIQAFIKGIQQQNDSPTVDQLLAKDELDFEGFLTWMTSSNGAITTPPTMEDLSWPLSTYFISSSHNTYLTGNQLYSDSSTKPYTDTLLRGGRCIEIDVWDGSESDVDTSDSSSSSDEEQTGTRGEKKPKSQKRKKSKLGFLKEKLPDVVASKLEKTSIGKKIDERDAKKAGETASTIPTATKTTTDTKTTATATTTDVKTTATTTTDATTATTDTATITGQATTQEPEPEPEPAAAVVEPRVLHGYTLTKEIRFRAVCESIRDSAFVVSNLPVIVSLEVHCSAEQQLVMVRIMREVFDGLLVAEPENDSPEVLPSPDELRGKLLIKVKYAPPPGTTTATEEESEEDDRAPAATAETANNKEATAAKKAPKIIQELSKMGIFTRGVSFKSLDQPEVGMASHVFSLSEKKVIDVHEKQAAELFNHNRHYLMRTYPWGLRIGSSNLDPSLFWRKGIQIVALNWQRWDEGMMLNEGMFAGTGGWVLKPEGKFYLFACLYVILLTVNFL